MSLFSGYVFVRGTLLCLIVLLSCLIITCVQALCLPLYFISPYWNHHCQGFLVGRQIKLMQIIFERINGAQVTYSGDKILPNDSALIMSNHQFGSDFYLIGALSCRVGMESYNRYFLKDSIKYLPLFGWSLYLTGMLFIKRDWLADQNKINKVFRTLLENRLPVWLITYPEGTRFSQKKMTESVEFCKLRDLEPFKNVLYPRTKGTVSSIKKLRNSHVRYVYDITMAYSSGGSDGFRKAPDLINIHYAHKISPPYRFHIHVEKFLLEDLPTDDEELSSWIVERFRVKDKLLDSLKGKGWIDNLDSSFKVRCQK